MLDEPFIFTIYGTDYKVEGCTQQLQGRFEQYMQHSLLNDLKARKDELGDDYLPLLERHVQLCSKGKYRFDGKSFWSFLDDENNVAELLLMCLSVHQIVVREKDGKKQFRKDVVLDFMHEHEDEAAELLARILSSKKNLNGTNGTCSDTVSESKTSNN